MKGRYVIFVACVILFSSCYLSKPIKATRDTSPGSMENIKIGKRYEIMVASGQKVFIRVDSVMSDRVFGDARIRVKHGVIRSQNHVIHSDDVLSIKQRKFSAPLTAGLIVGTAVVTMVMVYPGLNFTIPVMVL